MSFTVFDDMSWVEVLSLPLSTPAEPLQQHGRLRTAEVSLAQAVVAEVFEPHTLDPIGEKSLDARLNAVPTGEITLGYLTYGTETRILLPPSERWYHINITLAGSSRIARDGGDRGTTKGMSGAAILLPHRAQTIEWPTDAAQFGLKIPRTALEGHLATLARKRVVDPIEFDLVVNLESLAGKGLLRSLEFVRTEWGEGGILAQHPVTRRQLESVIMTSLLMAATGPHRALLEPVADQPKPVR